MSGPAGRGDGGPFDDERPGAGLRPPDPAPPAEPVDPDDIDDIGSVTHGHGRPGLIRRMYDWVLHWAETPYGSPALFVLSAAESSFFPIPPDPLLVALCLGRPKRSLRFAAIATVASVVGGIIGYGIGMGAWHALQDFFYTYVPGVDAHAFERVQAWYDAWGFWAVFMAGLTPIPYKVFTLSSGVFAINFPVFVLASALSRGIRFFVVAGLIYKFGQPIARFIDKYFDLLAIAFGVLLVGGFVAVKVLL